MEHISSSESLAFKSTPELSQELGVRSEGTAPDPSTQFSLFRLYMIEHPTFHSAQDDEMRRGVLIALRAVVISSVAERSFLQNG